MENIERVTNMRIGYMDWTQEKFYVTLIEKYRKGNGYMRIGYMNWITGTKFYVVH